FLDPVLLDHPAPTASYTLSLHDALPILIRYDTGDIGIMDIVDGSPVLTQVEGRKIDAVTNTKGEIISNNIMLLLNNYHELNQCQLIQKNTKDYVFKVNIDGVFKKEK